ncbi:hypothetical protein SAP269_20130 [Spiroplasma ixodetis]|uniref:Uncharacterized protein n=1 Tax=Spiroplasma ixodetis TaxID=2141 RepID=A0ABM8JQF7_9MOLU
MIKFIYGICLIEKFIKNESKRNIITGNGFTIGITSNKKNKSSFEFKNIHTWAEKIYKKHYSNDKILDTFPTINSYFIFLKKEWQIFY